jgi:hypothetical protein
MGNGIDTVNEKVIKPTAKTVVKGAKAVHNHVIKPSGKFIKKEFVEHWEKSKTHANLYEIKKVEFGVRLTFDL